MTDSMKETIKKTMNMKVDSKKMLANKYLDVVKKEYLMHDFYVDELIKDDKDFDVIFTTNMINGVHLRFYVYKKEGYYQEVVMETFRNNESIKEDKWIYHDWEKIME